MQTNFWKRATIHLNAAENALNQHGRPMPVDQLTTFALQHDLITSSGKTPTSTMRARLSEDLRKYAFHSTFQRVGPNRFALRNWGLPEYFAPPFKKHIPSEILTCIPTSSGLYSESAFGFLSDYTPLVDYISNPRNLTYINRPEAELRTDVRQLVAYVMLRDDIGRVLTYRRGAYSAAHMMLRGARCLGFGGHIQMDDSHSLFGQFDGGVFMASTREVAEELAGVTPQSLEICGAINDHSSPEGTKHIAIILDGTLPSDYVEERTSRERAINDLRLMNPAEIWERYHEFEFWSQLLIKNFWPQLQPQNRATIRPRRKNLHADTFVLIGEIASGKTTVANALSERLGFSVISTRRCVSNLIGVPDFESGLREYFQKKASHFIQSPDGPRRLAQEISIDASVKSGPVVIDGVRHSATLNHLRTHFPNALVFFIETPRDMAYANYKARAGRNASIGEFRQARHHPVEEQVSSLKHHADAYLFNGGTIDDLIQHFMNWWR